MIDKDLKKLELLIKDMESGELNLEDSLKKFQDGMNIIKTCKNTLEKAELTVAEIIKQNDGSFAEQDLEF